MDEDLRHVLIRELSRMIHAFETEGDPEVLTPFALMQLVLLQASTSAHLPNGEKDLAVARTVAWAHWCRYQGDANGQRRESTLAVALQWFNVIADAMPDSVPDAVQQYLKPQTTEPSDAAKAAEWGRALYEQYRRTADPAVLEAVIQQGRRAMAGITANSAEWAEYASNLGAALTQRYNATGQLDDLNESVQLGAEAGKALPENDHRLALTWSNLGVSLLTRFKVRHEMRDLELAVDAMRKAAHAAPSGHERRPTCLSNLASALLDRFDLLGTNKDLDDAVGIVNEAAAAAAPSNKHLPVILATQARVLEARHIRDGAAEDRAAAIRALRALVNAKTVGRQNHVRDMVWLGSYLIGSSSRKTIEDLTEAIEVLRKAEGLAEGSALQSLAFESLGIALKMRSDHSSGVASSADLNDAVATFRRALAAPAGEHLNREGILRLLARALRERSRRNVTTAVSDAIEAVTMFRELVTLIPADDPEYAEVLSELGIALQATHEYTAIGKRSRRGSQASSACRLVDTATQRIVYQHLAHLALALRVRFQEFHHLGDLTDSISSFRTAITASPRNAEPRVGARHGTDASI